MSIRYLFFAFLFSACTRKPDGKVTFDALKDGEAHIDVRMDGEAFYPVDSRFRGEVTVAPNRLRLNLTDQFESNVIITLDKQGLYDQRPIRVPITIDNQVAGSVMIGRVRDKVNRTGDGFLMTDGTLTIDSLSERRVQIRIDGRVGNFTTMHNRGTWKRLEGLLVYRKPPINVPADEAKSLLY